MSLKLWLPLNGKIDNCGLDTATVTACGGTATFVDGKNGKCLSCNGSTYWRITPFTLGATATFSFWAKTTDTNAMFFVLGATSYAHMNFWRYNSTYYLNKGDGTVNSFQNNGANVSWHTDNAWHHFILTFDGSACKLYVDGAYYGTSKTYVSPACNNTNIRVAGGFDNGHQYDSLCLLSDFRVYDHVVSEQDIKELYWGKVLDFRPEWVSATKASDASGFQRNMTPHNITINTNQVVFNGSTSYFSFEGINISGGTISAWVNVPSKPTAQKVIYCDPASKMVLGFISNGNLLTAANGATPSWLTTGMTWGQLNHIVATWNSSRQPVALYINGVAAAAGTSSDNWSNSGNIAGIGRRIGTGAADYLNGSINSLRVYTHQLTAEDVKELYDKGPVGFSLPDGYTMLDYIQSTGTQYIDAGIKACMNKIRCECEMAPMNNNDSAFFGSRGTYFLFYNVGGNYFWPTSKCETIHGTLALGHKYHVDWNKGTLIVSGDDGVFQKAVRSNSTQDSSNMYIFNFNPIDSRYTSAKLYWFRIWVDNAIVRNFIPCKRNSDNKAGLYDLISDTFFTNSGSGDFTTP